MQLLDGKKVSAYIRTDITKAVTYMLETKGIVPHLLAILIGEDPASLTYVSAKQRACESVGIKFTLIKKKEMHEAALLDLIDQINEDNSVDGFIVQLPLLKHIDAQNVIDRICPEKDVDGFNPINYGKMARNIDAFIPATPLGIMKLLQYYDIETSGKHCVIIGRGITVGAPLAILMSKDSYPGNCTVTVCHKHTRDLQEITKQADILISAAGQPKLITANMVKQGVVIVDVGITRITGTSKKNGYYLQGDVDFENVAPLCSYITPVPGGVGPMTIAALLFNVLQAVKKRH